MFKALADPARRLLLDRLRAENGQTLGQLCVHLEMTRQAVTKHLKVLEEASLVVPVWQGRSKFHYLNPVPIHEIAERWIMPFEQGRLRALADPIAGRSAGGHRDPLMCRPVEARRPRPGTPPAGSS